MKNITLKIALVLALVSAAFSPALAGNSQAYYTGALTFSNSNPTIYVGQTLGINIYTAGQYLNDFYVSQNSNPSVVTATISGSILNLYGNAYGTSNLLICQSSTNQCGTVYVTVSNGGVGAITFSNQNPTVAQYQTLAVSIYSSTNFYTSNFYVQQNSNNFAVTASVSGNTLSLYGNNPGAATLSICQNSTAVQCATLYVTVTTANGGSGSGTITFSNSSPSMYLNQSLAISIYSSNNNYNNSYYISQNTNNNVVTASVSGSVLSLYANNMGTSTITVCQTGLSACGSVYVTVGNGSGGYGSITFSISNPNMYVGQNQTINIYGNSAYNSSYYISQNSNPNVVSANVSGSSINLYANAQGSSSITVCQYSYSQCGTLYVTVNGNGSGGYGSITFSISNPNMYVGQSMQVTINSNYGYGGYSYYIQQNSNPGVVTTSINGNTLSLYAANNGSSTITVCQSGNGQCGTLYVTVNGNGNGGYGSGITFSNANPSLTVGQTVAVNIYGSNYNNGYANGYYISQNSNTAVVSTNIYGTTVNLFGMAAGSASITVCPNNSYTYGAGNSVCGTLYVTVNGNGNGGGGSVLGASVFPNGSLLLENGTIYIVYQNTKTGFGNFAAFRGFGFSLSNVQQVSSDSLTTSGSVISSSATSHPWGSWILYRGTVYLVSQSGVIPVPDPNTFTNNGGQYNLIVPANSYDLNLPVLSVMTLNDSRLQ